MLSRVLAAHRDLRADLSGKSRSPRLQHRVVTVTRDSDWPAVTVTCRPAAQGQPPGPGGPGDSDSPGLRVTGTSHDMQSLGQRPTGVPGGQPGPGRPRPGTGRVGADTDSSRPGTVTVPPGPGRRARPGRPRWRH